MDTQTISEVTPAVVPADSTPATEIPVAVLEDSGTSTPQVVVTMPRVPAPSVEPTDAEKRIRQLVAQRKEAEEKREKEQQEKEYWRGLAEGRQTPAPAPSPKNLAPVAPNIDKSETYEDYEAAREKYLIDRTKWEIRQEQAEGEQRQKKAKEQEQRKAEMGRVAQNWETQKIAAQDRYPDFHTAISDPSFVQTAVTDFLIRESSLAADLAYYLAKNPAEMAKLNTAAPHVAAKAIGVLENKIEKERASVVKSVLSQAPTPIETVSGGKGADDVDDDNLPIEEYIKRRNRKQGLIKGS